MTEQPSNTSNFSLDVSTYKLAELNREIGLHNLDEYRDASLALAQQATRQILIQTQVFDKDIYDRPLFIDAVSAFARSAPLTEVKILLHDPYTALRGDHRMIELCRRLSSTISVRRLKENYLKNPDEFMLVDSCGYISRDDYQNYQAKLNFNDKPQTQNLSIGFNEVWNISTPETEFRQLHL